MASCLVPDLPAVMMALEHLGELDKRLKEDKLPFSHEASYHLREIAAAITEVESSRRSVREQLEVETIVNGKLRHRVHKIRDKISQEIMADVSAARESNAEEIGQLHKDLNSISQLHEVIVNRQAELIRQNALLYPEREQVKTEHERDIVALNHQMSLKASSQIHLNQTLNKVEELKTCIATMEQNKITLEQNILQERENFNMTKNSLLSRVDQAVKKILQQKQENARQKKKLDKTINQQLDKDDHLTELTHHRTQIECSIARLAASQGQYEQQLREEVANHQDIVEQMERSESDLSEQMQYYETTTQRLQEDIILVEHDVEEAKAVRSVYQASLANVTESFNSQSREEEEATSVHLNVSRRLERSILRLNDRMASIAKHRSEAREMEENIRQLLENNIINDGVFQKNQEKLHSQLDAERNNISRFEEEKGKLTRLLQEAKKEQEMHVAKATSDISNTRRNYQELRQEEVTLRQNLSMSDEIDSLTGLVIQAGLEFVRMESAYHQEIERYTRYSDRVLRETEEKKMELEEKEVHLKEAEAHYNEEESVLRRVEKLTTELKSKKSRLALSIEELQQNTAALLGPREQRKAELDAMRAHHRGLLVSQASDLKAVEVSICDTGLKLEQVNKENNRMHLCIVQMTLDIANAREDKQRYTKRIASLGEETITLFESILQAWREDLLVTQDCRDSNRVLLEAFGVMLGQLKDRKVQFEKVIGHLHDQLLYISKILHNRSIT